MSERPIWTPDSERVQSSRLTAFRHFVNDRWGIGLGDYAALYEWSLEAPEHFWGVVWDFCEVIGEPGNTALENGGQMPGARWFPEARLNFAENLLRLRDNSDAVVFCGEGKVTRRLSHSELYGQVAQLAA